MPVLESTKKALRSSQRKEERNKKIRGKIKRQRRNFKKLVSDGKVKKAQKYLSTVQKTLDKAAKKNIFHKNKSARLKSGMARMLKQKKTKKG